MFILISITIWSKKNETVMWKIKTTTHWNSTKSTRDPNEQNVIINHLKLSNECSSEHVWYDKKHPAQIITTNSAVNDSLGPTRDFHEIIW